MQMLIRQWVYGGTLAGLLMLGLMPAIGHGESLAWIFVFLQLPVYMLHQWEEHHGDRFRIFVNQVVGGGKELLTPAAVFVINVPGVWGVNAISILLATFLSLGFGLIGIYLTLVNALVHAVQGVALRKYHPGLISALVLFFPVGGVAWWLVGEKADLFDHVLGLSSAVAIHAAIVGYVRLRAARL